MEPYRKARRMTGRGAVAEWVRTRNVPSLSKLVLLLVFDRAGEQEDGRWCAWPSLQTLADEAGIGSIATVRKHLAALEAAGIISREARHVGSGRQTSSRIVLLFAPTHSHGSGYADGSGGPAPSGAGDPLPTERGTTLKPQNEAQEEAPLARAGEPTVTYRGKRVPVATARAALRAVETWAARTSQTIRQFDGQGKPTDSLKRVIGAMQAFPEVIELWPAMIDAALARPWWEGTAPGVGVVFGPRVVERMIEQAKRGPGDAGALTGGGGGPRRGGPSAADFAAYARGEA
jgi:hypothetical protein